LEWGIKLKRGFKTYAFIILLVLGTIFVLDYFDISRLVTNLQNDKISLIEKVSRLEKQNQKSSTETEQLKNENKQLVEQISQLEEEVKELKSFVQYQDFNDAISTVNSYKTAKTFVQANNYIADGIAGYSYLDFEGNCPCSFNFDGRGFEWKPNVVGNLSEFRTEKGKIILIFNSVQNEHTAYQFVMTKASGFKENKSSPIGFDLDKEEKWRIREIKETE
jgi:regulator of replication initiation timing